MAPFAQLPFHVLTPSARAVLRLYVLEHPKEVRDHLDTRTRRRTGLSHFDETICDLIPDDMARLRKVCPLPFTPALIYCRSETHVARHVDGIHWLRQCTIATPLYPKEGYADTVYWPDMHATELDYVLHWTRMPVLMDIQHPHSITNNASPRFNFQLAFGTPFAEVLELLRAGSLDVLRAPEEYPQRAVHS